MEQSPPLVGGGPKNPPGEDAVQDSIPSLYILEVVPKGIGSQDSLISSRDRFLIPISEGSSFAALLPLLSLLRTIIRTLEVPPGPERLRQTRLSAATTR